MDSQSGSSVLTLLTLPPEIRSQIWGLVVKLERPVHLRHHLGIRGRDSNKASQLNPADEASITSFVDSIFPIKTGNGSETISVKNYNAIFLVNSQVYHEALAVFCSINTFIATDFNLAFNWLLFLRSLVPDLTLGPLICWIDKYQPANTWEALLALLRSKLEVLPYSPPTITRVKIFFETPIRPEAMEDWKRNSCAPGRYRLASEGDTAQRTDLIGTLGRMVVSESPDEGGLCMI
ncbi:hypothetical protein PG999_003605 [Apiospora kogelbergensis]|uniref:Uncharacterized protein n=1 Tax=Apiospora kogelbergensis TaxID=1337665 RepID=A0AAW0R434_9PEZI